MRTVALGRPMHYARCAGAPMEHISTHPSGGQVWSCECGYNELRIEKIKTTR